MPKLIYPQNSVLVEPINESTKMALDACEAVLLAGDSFPHLLEPIETFFHAVILAASQSLANLEDTKLYRLSALSAIDRPPEFWRIIDELIKADDKRKERRRGIVIDP